MLAIEPELDDLMQAPETDAERGDLLSDQGTEVPLSTHVDRDARPEWDGPEEDTELDLTPGPLGESDDPVRTYLREMGRVRLLTRQGEVSIAQRIERGQILALRALSRS